MAFLTLSREKLVRTLVLCAVLPGAFLLGSIPPSLDLLDLRQLGRALAGGLIGGPIRALDLLTDSAFAPRSEGFLVFPSTIQLGFALACDVLLFYLFACAWVRWRGRRGGPSVGAMGPSE